MATVRKRTYIEKQRIQDNYYVMAFIYALGLEHARKGKKKAAQSNTVASLLAQCLFFTTALFFPADALTLSVASLPWLPPYSGHFLRYTSWPLRKGSTVLSNQVPNDWVIYTASARETRSMFFNSFSYPVCCSTDIFKTDKMGSSDSPVTGFHTSANLFTNPEPTRTKVKVTRTPFALYLSRCCFELYYDTVLMTISFLWWLYQGCEGKWVKIFPPKQCHSAVRHDNAGAQENLAEKSDRLRIFSKHFAIIPSRTVP